jgi:hypothetical protein
MVEVAVVVNVNGLRIAQQLAQQDRFSHRIAMRACWEQPGGLMDF